MQKYCRLVFVMICLIFIIKPACANSIIWKQIQIPMPEAGSQGLETLLVWPNTPAKHPVAILSHGSPRDTTKRPEMTAVSSLPIAMEFARRGFAVAVVMRRGYGHSGGTWSESYGSCNAPIYLHAALASSQDLHAAIHYLSTLPQYDIQHMIAVGVSAGGLATIALTADNPPPGLLAAISFAGGRGSTADNTVCDENALVSTFATLGKTSRVPMLWIYAENDHFFNPKLAERFLKAFNSNGGHATFVQADAFDAEGHYLFSANGIPKWTPIVDDFLTSQHLIFVKNLLSLPADSHLTTPNSLSADGKKAFAEYLSRPPHKAFAISSRGAYGWRSGRYSIEDAKKEALENCRKHDANDCKVIASV